MIRRVLPLLAPLIVACAPPPPCSPVAAYDRGARGLGLDPRCPADPALQAAGARGFADALRLRRLATFPADTLSGRRRPTPGEIEIAPLEP
ncbi:MAG: hypothetical protein AAF763_13170 [Pseudomonadota bacterium]